MIYNGYEVYATHVRDNMPQLVAIFVDEGDAKIFVDSVKDTEWEYHIVNQS